jgi:hypothetical protein
MKSRRCSMIQLSPRQSSHCIIGMIQWQLKLSARSVGLGAFARSRSLDTTGLHKSDQPVSPRLLAIASDFDGMFATADRTLPNADQLAPPKGFKQTG